MGFDWYNLSWDFNEEIEMKQMRRTAKTFTDNATHITDLLQTLTAKIDKLTLLSQAMWSLLEEQGVSEKALQQKIEALQTRPAKQHRCSDCNHPISQNSIKRRYCVLCGNPTLPEMSVHEWLEF